MLLNRRSLVIILSLALVSVFLNGCGDGSGARRAALSQQVEKLTEEKLELERQAAQLRKENEGLRKQMEVLAALPGEKRAEAIYTLKEVTIGRFTDLYDKDDNGGRETLIVYIQPIDETGDAIKAAGAVDLQLWDLSRPSDEALLAQWDVGPEELRKIWFDSIAMTGYRLTYDVGSLVGNFDKPLTVKVTFTDYLSGKVFTGQKIIEP